MKRKKQVKRIKKAISKYSDSDLFCTDHVISMSGFLDFYFIGEYKGKEVVWNATLVSTESKFLEELDEAAYTIAADKFPNLTGIEEFIFEPYGEEGEMQLKNNPDFSTIRKARHKLQGEYIQEQLEANTRSVLLESTEIDEDYEFGVGLLFYRSYDEITVELIEQLINDFVKNPQNSYSTKTLTLKADDPRISIYDGHVFLNGGDTALFDL